MRTIMTGLTCLIIIAVHSPAQADWPGLAGPDRSAMVNPGNVLRTWPDAGPPVLWTVPLGEGFAGAAIRDGQVFVLDRIGKTGDVLCCFDLNTGAEQWKYAYDAPGSLPGYNGSRAVPTVDDKYIYTVGPFGHMHCISRKTHKPVWSKHLLTDFNAEQPKWGMSQSPLRYKDWLILAPCGKDIGLIAVEPDTGKIVWKTQPIGELHHNSPIVFNIAGRDQVLFITTDGVWGFDAANGKTLWRYPGYAAKRYIPAPIAVPGDRVFITAGYNAGSRMLKIARDGEKFSVKELWRIDLIGAHCHQPLLVGDHLYLLCNTNERKDGLVCLGLDGQIKWQTERQPWFDKGGLVLIDGLIHIMEGARGTLHLVQPNPDKFTEICHTPQLLDGPKIWAPLAFSDGLLVIRNQKEMKCVDLRK